MNIEIIVLVYVSFFRSIYFVLLLLLNNIVNMNNNKKFLEMNVFKRYMVRFI